MTREIFVQDKRRVLVTGANGFVGKALCRELQVRGYAIRAAARAADFQSSSADMVKIGAIDGETDWSEALRDVNIVIHLAARVHVMSDRVVDPLEEFRKVNVAGTERLARMAVAHGVKRFVYVSSIKVNGEKNVGEFGYTELDIPAPLDSYGLSKWEAEQALHRIANETGLELVIIRPPLVYGANVKGNFAQMLKVLAAGIPLPLASVHNRRSLVYVENLVDALIACAVHPAAAGQSYLVSDGEDISTPDLLRRLGAAMGSPARLFSFPPVLLKLAGRATGKSDQVERLQESLQIDSGKIRRELNWTPPYSLQQGLQATAEWYRNTHL